MMVGNGHNADGGRLNKNFHGLDVCNVINTAAAKISVLKIFSDGLFFFSDLNLSDILERCEAFWVPRSTVRVQGRRLCQDFQRDG